MSSMLQKREFIKDWISDAYTVSHLCEHYGISRSLGHRIIDRFRTFGDAGLEERSRAPHHIANKTAPKVEAAICAERKAHPRWGSEKILTVLKGEFSEEELPALSTGDLILKRNGLIIPRRRKRRVEPVFPIFDPKACNEVWSTDFKGKFRMGNQVYCNPLTIADSFSRIVFSAKGLYATTFLETQAEFKVVFKENGLPLQIHSDNGVPFGSVQSLNRLTRLAVWFIELGIEPVYSDPAHPEQNGRHERMPHGSGQNVRLSSPEMGRRSGRNEKEVPQQAGNCTPAQPGRLSLDSGHFRGDRGAESYPVCVAFEREALGPRS
jgi:transposase InsO family protein